MKAGCQHGQIPMRTLSGLHTVPSNYVLGFPGGSEVKCLSTMRETRVRSLGLEDALEKEMAIHSNTIAWKISWTEEPGRPQSMGCKELDTHFIFLFNNYFLLWM